MSRREIFAGNWKMHKTRDEALDLVHGLLDGLDDIGPKEVIVFPPSPYAVAVCDITKGTAIDVGIQNMYFEDEGAFTGEVSPLMVKDTGCRYILIGHSERRHVFGEDDEMVNKKVRAAFAHGLEPVICVGELLEQRESGNTADVIKKQTQAALDGISKEQMNNVIIAYEPVWAIGTGKVATPEIADEAHAIIRGLVRDLYGSDTADIVPVLYGGSVKPDNIKGLYEKENLDGVLVGGASLKVGAFLGIINV